MQDASVAQDVQTPTHDRREEPRLSIVATSRNDDHGGHLLERMQWFIDGLAWNTERTGTPVELIMVEWNPPEGGPPLAEALRWPSPGGLLSCRIVTVPAVEHRRLMGCGGTPMMQMLAKNVGIRRARAEHILVTNIDILLSPSLFCDCLECVGDGIVWRADRYDVEFPFDEEVKTVAEALEWCTRRPVRYNRHDGVHYPAAGRQLPIYQGTWDFVRWHARRATLTHLRESRTRRTDTGALPTLGKHHPEDPRSLHGLVRFAADRLLAATELVVLPKLHVNACGDFTLLSATDWARLRGYPEWTVHSLHVDTLFMHQAHAMDMRFVEFQPPSVTYHMEHEAGSGWSPEAQVEHLAAVSETGMPYIGAQRLRREKRGLYAAHLRRRKVVFNATDWGLANAALPEQEM